MKSNSLPVIDVTKEGPLDEDRYPPPVESFKTIKSLTDDFKGIYKPPQRLWDDSFIGEAIPVEDCHPPNSSFLIGATGGILTGLVTGFFSTTRIPLPIRTPIPSSYLPKVQLFLRNSIMGSSILWRITKRTVVGTILFAVLECDFRDMVKKQSEKWKGSLVAGAVSGGILGLRGALTGMGMGVVIFTTIPGAFEVYLRKEQIRSRFFNP